MRRWAGSIAATIALAAALAAIMLAIGVRHNPQCEFYCDGQSFDYGYAALVFASWFVPAFAVVLPIVLTASVLQRRRRHSSRRRHSTG